MKLGMMQPYFYAYLGYWQLMNMVDEYVIYDDVNFIKGGWIHRNRIKINGEPQFFGLSVKKISQNRKINEHFLNPDTAWRDVLVSKVQAAYGKAPYFKDVMELFKDTLYDPEESLSKYLLQTNQKIAAYMGIKTPIRSITDLNMPHEMTGKDRVIDVCQRLGADSYVNAIGGTELYDKDEFRAAGIDLSFLRMDSDIVYDQGKGNFISGLSILDVLMYNSVSDITDLLDRFSIE